MSRTGEPAADVEPPADYYRRILRTIKARCDGLSKLTPNEGSIDALAAEALSRERSNGPTIDRLEAEVARLRGELVDQDMLRRELGLVKAELAENKRAATEAQAQLDAVLGTVRKADTIAARLERTIKTMFNRRRG